MITSCFTAEWAEQQSWICSFSQDVSDLFFLCLEEKSRKRKLIKVRKLIFLPYCDVYPCETTSWFCPWEIARMVVVCYWWNLCELSHPYASKHIIREERDVTGEGMFFWLKITWAHHDMYLTSCNVKVYAPSVC